MWPLPGSRDMIEFERSAAVGAEIAPTACAGPTAGVIRGHDQYGFNRPPRPNGFGAAKHPYEAARGSAQGQSAPPQGPGTRACRGNGGTEP